MLQALRELLSRTTPPSDAREMTVCGLPVQANKDKYHKNRKEELKIIA